jgi:hypothetical protein
MRRIVLIVLVLAGCRRETSPPSGPDSTTPGSASGGAATTAGEGGATEPERCAGGVPWDGRPSGCAYEVDGCCYNDAEAACAAVKCARDACEILETYPAQVRCRTP